MIQPDRWGKDHWSLLAYVETCCVDHRGKLSVDRMRCHPKRHPDKYSKRIGMLLDGPKWQTSWGTRLKGYFEETDKKRLLLTRHDDWDCLEDLKAAGLVTIADPQNNFVQMTATGSRVVAMLREWLAGGGNYATFGIERAVLTA